MSFLSILGMQPANTQPRTAYNNALNALAKDPKRFQVIIDGKRTTISDLFDRLHTPGKFPKKSIHISHPDYWILDFGTSESTYPSNNNDHVSWSVYKKHPATKYGFPQRSYRSFTLKPSEIWSHIEREMTYDPDLIVAQPVHNTYLHKPAMNAVLEEKARRQKIGQIHSDAIMKLLEQKGLPENLEPEFASYFEPKTYASGYKSVTNNFKKINTTLFQGGKKKARKGKTRKHKK